jgi:tRNA(Arg) A34 adenosine deaminase TadA
MNETDLTHLRRCIELAAAAVDAGDQPYGSVLVSADGSVLAERRNEVVTTGDVTAHPELALASWASRHLDPDERAGATVYTSGEHCAMCATAHVKAGIGRLVYVLSAPMIAEVESGDGPTVGIRVHDVVAASDVEVVVEGPCPELAGEATALFGTC